MNIVDGTDSAAMLIARFQDRKATIGIVGLGYVGLPLAFTAVGAGFSVLAFDIDEAKVDLLRSGKSYLKHIDASQLRIGLEERRFDATTDFSRAGEPDALIICVPTPLGEHREPDTSFIESTIDSLVPHLRSGQLVSLESSTYPSTTRTLVAAPIEAAGHEIGKDIFVVYSPEREDPGNKTFSVSQIPKIVAGYTDACLAAGEALYRQLVAQVVPTASLEVGEMAKLLENIYRAVNIGLANEMKIVADRLGVDIWAVIDAAATKPFGFTPFYPGPGLGGHCIPIDPFYLTWKAREVGVNARFIELAGEVNNSMPDWVVDKTIRAINRSGKSVQGARILVLGVAYKKNIDDMRESPAVEIIELLLAEGANVDYSDPYVPHVPRMRRHHLNLTSVSFTDWSIDAYDCVVLATDHDDYDYDMIQRKAKLIVDCRGRYRTPFENVVKA